MQLTPGDVDLTVSDARGRGPRDAGLVTFVPANTPHAVMNAGAQSFDLIAIALKPMRPAAPAAPPTEAPPGITRTTLIDNSDTCASSACSSRRAAASRFTPIPTTSSPCS